MAPRPSAIIAERRPPSLIPAPSSLPMSFRPPAGCASRSEEAKSDGLTHGLFLFTDIEGSTRLWQQDEAAMRAALERHDAILRSTIDGHGGYVFSTGGDGFGAAFARAG